MIRRVDGFRFQRNLTAGVFTISHFFYDPGFFCHFFDSENYTYITYLLSKIIPGLQILPILCRKKNTGYMAGGKNEKVSRCLSIRLRHP